MIYEWTNESNFRNFGDALYSEVYSQDFLNYCDSKDDYVFFLIGSLICDEILDHATYLGKKAVFIHCGWNGRTLSKLKAEKAIYIGARGNKTIEILRSFDIEVHGTLDPIYGLKLQDSVEEDSKGKSYFVPHISESQLFTDGGSFGCTDILSPKIADNVDIGILVSKVKSSSFVLSGSMHIAMLAHHLEIPFALFSSAETGFIDHPLKWIDWLSNYGIHDADIKFVSHQDAGKEWYKSLESVLTTDKHMLDISRVELATIYKILSDEPTIDRDELATDRIRIMQEKIVERNQIAADRERIIQEMIVERNQIAADRDRIMQALVAQSNSTIWKTTQPIRWLVNLFKG